MSLCPGSLEDSAVDQFLKCAMGGDQRDGELFGEFLGGRHLFAGREDTFVDGFAHGVSGRDIERPACLRNDGFQHLTHDNPV